MIFTSKSKTDILDGHVVKALLFYIGVQDKSYCIPKSEGITTRDIYFISSFLHLTTSIAIFTFPL